MNPIFRNLLWCVLVLLGCRPAHGLEVTQALWNFAGGVVPQRMNLLSVQVRNDSGQNVDVALRLARVGAGMNVGLAQVEPCFLSPGSSRWVQFMTPIQYGQEEFELSWGKGPRERFALPRLGTTAAEVVVLRAGWQSGARGSTIRHFPAELFPTHVMGAQNLHAALLDELPGWDPPRRVALREWVYGGGTLHVLPGAGGRHPVFSGDLAALQGTEPVHVHGQGRVVRHDVPLVEMSAAKLASLGYAVPDSVPQNYGQAASHIVLQALGARTRADHPWGLIFTLGVVYLVLIGPVGLVVARRVRDPRWSLLLLVVVIVAFSAAYLVVGRRGYGEQSTIQWLGYARPVGQGWYDLTQYVQVFVTSGDQYTIASAGTHSVFATVYDNEPVRGQARGGLGGQAIVDMPLFSKRELLHRGRTQGWAATVRVSQWPTLQQPGRAVLELDGDAPQASAIWLTDGTWVSEVESRSGSTLTMTKRHEVKEFLLDNAVFYGNGMQMDPQQRERLARRLMADALGLRPENDWSQQQKKKQEEAQAAAPVEAPRQLHLFVLCQGPPGMAIHAVQGSKQEGDVLYHFTLSGEHPELKP